MKEKVFELLVAMIIALVVVSIFSEVFTLPSDKEVQATMMKHVCTPTNEFVGEEGDRLYLCQDGIKYKYEDLVQLSIREKK